jgi:hydrogenase expression/formation protein HypC
MCLGIPGRIVEPLETIGGLEQALVEFGGLRRRVCTACVPDARPGDYIIVHAGIAISVIDAEEAERVRQHLETLGEMAEPEAEPGHEVPR